MSKVVKSAMMTHPSKTRVASVASFLMLTASALSEVGEYAIGFGDKVPERQTRLKSLGF